MSVQRTFHKKTAWSFSPQLCDTGSALCFALFVSSWIANRCVSLNTEMLHMEWEFTMKIGRDSFFSFKRNCRDQTDNKMKFQRTKISTSIDPEFVHKCFRNGNNSQKYNVISFCPELLYTVTYKAWRKASVVFGYAWWSIVKFQSGTTRSLYWWAACLVLTSATPDRWRAHCCVGSFSHQQDTRCCCSQWVFMAERWNMLFSLQGAILDDKARVWMSAPLTVLLSSCKAGASRERPNTAQPAPFENVKTTICCALRPPDTSILQSSVMLHTIDKREADSNRDPRICRSKSQNWTKLAIRFLVWSNKRTKLSFVSLERHISIYWHSYLPNNKADLPCLVVVVLVSVNSFCARLNNPNFCSLVQLPQHCMKSRTQPPLSIGMWCTFTPQTDITLNTSTVVQGFTPV